LEHPELFKTCILVDTNTLAPGISKNRQANGSSLELSRVHLVSTGDRGSGETNYLTPDLTLKTALKTAHADF
jgi:hypothetical protein